MGGAGDVARAARTGAGLFQRPVHGIQHDLILALAEIIVGAPDGDFLFALGAGPDGLRKTTSDALKIGKDPVAAFLSDRLHGILEMGLVGKRHETRLLGPAPISE